MPLLGAQQKGRPIVFTMVLIGIIFWGASWLWEPTRVFWNELDNFLFFHLNSRLTAGHLETTMWAIANNRMADMAPALAMLSLFIWIALRDTQHPPATHIARMLFMVLFIVLIMLIAKQIFDINRVSPSLILEPRNLLSELVPWANPKDASSNSFPGDHGAVLLLWSFFIIYYGGYGYGLLALAIAVLFALPRIVAGAHWATDLLIGSTSIAVIGFCLARCTPLENWSVTKLEPLGNAIWRLAVGARNKIKNN